MTNKTKKEAMGQISPYKFCEIAFRCWKKQSFEVNLEPYFEKFKDLFVETYKKIKNRTNN